MLVVENRLGTGAAAAASAALVMPEPQGMQAVKAQARGFAGQVGGIWQWSAHNMRGKTFKPHGLRVCSAHDWVGGWGGGGGGGGADGSSPVDQTRSGQ
jgi:hypothetical protein